MKRCAVLLLGTLAWAQDDRPKYPFENGQFQSFDTKTGELLVEIKSEEVKPVAEKAYLFKRPEAVLYPKDQEGEVHRTTVTANEGTYDENKRLLTLTGQVRLRAREGEGVDAESVELTLSRRYRQDHLVVRGPFKMTKPQFEAEGTDLDGDLLMDNYTVSSVTRMHMVGRPDEPKASSGETDLSSRGKATMERVESGLEYEVLKITAHDQVKAAHRGPFGVTQFGADDMTLRVRRAKGKIQELQKLVRYAPEWIHATGHATMKDDEGLDATGEDVRYSNEAEVVQLIGSPVEIAKGESKVRARRVQIDRVTNVITCRDSVDAMVKKDETSPPTHVTSDVARVWLHVDGTEWQVSAFEASGHTIVDDVDAHIECSQFDWNLLTQRGKILGDPVRVTRPVAIRAPIILIKGRTLCLRGPKNVVVTQGADRYVATSRGDILFDGKSLTMQDDAVLSGPDFRVRADVVRARLGEDRKLESIGAFGHLTGTMRTEGERANVYADRLTLRGSDLTIYGRPDAVLASEGSYLQSNVLTWNRDTGRFKASNFGKQGRIVFTRPKPR